MLVNRQSFASSSSASNPDELQSDTAMEVEMQEDPNEELIRLSKAQLRRTVRAGPAFAMPTFSEPTTSLEATLNN